MDPNAFRPIWGDDDQDRGHAVPPAAIAAHAVTLGKTADWDRQQCDVEPLRICEPSLDVSVRAGWGRSVYGCCNGWKLCRIHGAIDRDTQFRLDGLSALLMAWSSVGGAAAARSMSRFAYLDSEQPLDAPFPRPEGSGTIVMLVDWRERPVRVPYFIVCAPIPGDNRYLDHLPPIPFDIELLFAPGRISPQKRCVMELTCDELCLDLVTRPGAAVATWRLLPLHAEPCYTANNLKTFQVTGVAPEFVPVIRAPRVRDVQLPSAMIDDLLEASDPFACGARHEAAQQAPGQRGGGGPPGDAQEMVVDEDAELFLDLEQGNFLDDVFSNMLEEEGIPEVGIDPVPGEESDSVESNEAAAEQDGQLLQDDEDEDSAAGGAGIDDAGYSVQDYVNASCLSFEGHVTCALPPWCHLRRVGQISIFPFLMPFEQQKFSVRCNVHKHCSWIIKRSHASYESLLAWLYLARRPATAEEERSFRDEHMAESVALRSRLASF